MFQSLYDADLLFKGFRDYSPLKEKKKITFWKPYDLDIIKPDKPMTQNEKFDLVKEALDKAAFNIQNEKEFFSMVNKFEKWLKNKDLNHIRYQLHSHGLFYTIQTSFNEFI